MEYECFRTKEHPMELRMEYTADSEEEIRIVKQYIVCFVWKNYEQAPADGYEKKGEHNRIQDACGAGPVKMDLIQYKHESHKA